MHLESYGKVSHLVHLSNSSKRLTHREREVAGIVLLHIDIEATCARHLLQLTLRTRGATEVIQTADDTEHGRQCDFAGFLAQAGMRTETVLDVGVHWAVEVDFLWVRENGWVTVGFDLLMAC